MGGHIAGNFCQRNISSEATVRQFVRNLISSNVGRHSLVRLLFFILSFIFIFKNISDPTIIWLSMNERGGRCSILTRRWSRASYNVTDAGILSQLWVSRLRADHQAFDDRPWAVKLRVAKEFLRLLRWSHNYGVVENFSQEFNLEMHWLKWWN